MQTSTKPGLGWGAVATASIGLVVASTTFAGDFNAFGMAGSGYAFALLFGFLLNIIVASAYVELTVMFPSTGQVFEFTKQAFSDQTRRPKYLLATGIGVIYWLMFGVVWASESLAGAHAIHTTIDIGGVVLWVVLFNLFAIVVNILGIRVTIFTEVILVCLMVGVRIAFGIAAYLGVTQTGINGSIDALAANFLPYGVTPLLSAIPLAVWAFIGLEFATPLVSEVENPTKNMSKGIFVGALIILCMALIMGIGIVATLPIQSNPDAYTGNAPQIVIATILFGRLGGAFAAISSAIATLGSLLIAYAAIPRVIYAMAQDGALSSALGTVHSRFGSPWVAILASGIVFIAPILISTQVVSLVKAATVLWLLIYMWVLMIVVKLRFSQPDTDRPFQQHPGVYVLGILLIASVLWVGYQGTRLLIIAGLGIVLAGFVYSLLWYETPQIKLRRRS